MGSNRSTLLFYLGACAPPPAERAAESPPRLWSAGKLLRRVVVDDAAVAASAAAAAATGGNASVDVRGLLCDQCTSTELQAWRCCCSDCPPPSLPHPQKRRTPHQRATRAHARPRVQVRCSEWKAGQHLRHAQVAARLAASLFCAIMPGDTQASSGWVEVEWVGRVGQWWWWWWRVGGWGGGTQDAQHVPFIPCASLPQTKTPHRRLDKQASRRLSEAVLAGCLPVFFGRPYNTLPLEAEVNYAAFSVGGGKGCGWKGGLVMAAAAHLQWVVALLGTACHLCLFPTTYLRPLVHSIKRLSPSPPGLFPAA